MRRTLILVGLLAVVGCGESDNPDAPHCPAFCEIRDNCGWMGLSAECMDQCIGPADECEVWCTASVAECETKCGAWEEDLQHAHRVCLGRQGCDDESPAFIPEYRDCVEAECTTCEF